MIFVGIVTYDMLKKSIGIMVWEETIHDKRLKSNLIGSACYVVLLLAPLFNCVVSSST